MQYVDLYFWLVGDILLKTDKMSMAHSLESRVPFLDRRVFDVSATIPAPLKANESQTKLALREASERAIPKDWAQKEKLGFPVPVVNWLREDRYYNQVKEWFTGDIAREFFNTDELVRLLDEHKAGADRSRKIWIVYMFLMWYKIYFVDKTVPEKPKAQSVLRVQRAKSFLVTCNALASRYFTTSAHASLSSSQTSAAIRASSPPQRRHSLMPNEMSLHWSNARARLQIRTSGYRDSRKAC